MTGKRCKSLTNIHVDQLKSFENFLPIMRKKEFAKVLSNYFYEQLNFMVDCIEFHHSYKETFSDEGEPDGYDYKSYKYRPNKKKKRQYLLILNIVVVLINKPNLKNKIMKNGGGNGGGCGCGK